MAKTKKVFDGRYEILSIVGRGARSVVYHARHVASPATQVALKVLVNQKGKNPSAERLRREALAMVSCRHRYIARLDDFHSVGTLCYLAMEYAPESDLRNFVNKHGGKLTIEQGERFLKQSAEGLAFVHRAGIIHRDIKPENILVMNEKEVRITDFGVALLPGEECSIADLQSGVGTMNYMAPEILEGKPADQRSDLYALGVVFYELVSGQNPFSGAPLARQIDVRKSENFPSLNQIDSTIPIYFSDLIQQCMRYDPDLRFGSGDDLLANLINKKSDNFSKDQKVLRQKPTRPKTNDLHKRPRKPQAKRVKDENEDLFDEFDRLVAEEAAAKGISSAKPNQEPVVNQSDTTGISTKASLTEQENIAPEQSQTSSTAENSEDLFGESIFDDEDELSDKPESSPKSIENSDVENLSEQITTSPEQSDDFDDSFEEGEPRTQSSARSPYLHEKNQQKRLGLIGLSFLLLLILVVPAIRHAIFGVFSSGIKTLTFWKQSTIELPIFEANSLTFPMLPKGVFSGALEGVLPGKTVPLTIISFGENGKIAVLLGIEGWTPVVIDQHEMAAKAGARNSKALRIASNGIILEMTGEIKGNQVVGYFSNLINGSQGQWNVEPAI